MNYTLLNKIDSPEDMKDLLPEDLLTLSKELRQFIIDEVSSNPGHLGASLGVVELTVALHHVFNAPEDKIVWDVGHQAYSHKILTGRRNTFHTNRKYGGISGFPRRDESPYDAFQGGHSSVSISAALGMAIADQKKGKQNHAIAVIGDGSLTGGVAFEGLNNAGSEKANLLIILNDNNISIDPSVGALKDYLTDITASKTYNKLKDEVWNLLGILNKLGPNYQKLAQKIERSIKSFFSKQSNLFESFNFRYFGPVDGNDVLHLISILKDLREIPGPKILHCLTKKGKGYSFAEASQTIWHSPGKFNKLTGEIIKLHSSKSPPPKYQKVFGKTLLELAIKNDNIVGVTPAMQSGSSMDILKEALPERVYDVGIAEQHAVTFSAGLATEGIIPFCNIYSTFLQRSYDQIIHDVALQNLPVVFCIDRAGLVGSDGPSHHGAYDIAFLRCIPNMTIAAPMDEIELRNMLYTAQLNPKGPISIRYPKGRGIYPEWKKPFQEIPAGKGREIKAGADIAILTIGQPGIFAKQAIAQFNEELLSVALYDMRFVKPLDEDLLHSVFKRFDEIICIEDGCIKGGFGSAILEFANEHGYKSRIKMLGIPDRFIPQGDPEELYALCGFDVKGIVTELHHYVKKKIYNIAAGS